MGHVVAAAWRLVGGSVTGSLHRRQGRGCDDAFGWHVDDAVLVAVTADGAGSRPGTSALGAYTAVAAVVAAAAEKPQVEPLFEAALGAVVDAACELGVAPDLLATTLSVAVIAGDAGRGRPGRRRDRGARGGRSGRGGGRGGPP